MLYSMKILKTTTAAPRVVDAHSLLHLRVSKSVKACGAADVVDGHAVLQNPTLRLAAAAYGVSLGSVARARRLTPEQRQAVRNGQRPLVLPSTPTAPPVLPFAPVPPAAPATPPVPPVTMDLRERLPASCPSSVVSQPSMSLPRSSGMETGRSQPPG
jgi:hypothetical protein